MPSQSFQTSPLTEKKQISWGICLKFSSVTQLCLTLCDPMVYSTPGLCPSPTPGVHSNSCPLSQWCHPIISSSVIPFSSYNQSFPALGSFPMSQFFTSRGQKYWSFSFNISPSNEHSGLISFRMDWLDLLAVQGIVKSLLQHHSSKASILWQSTFFIVQLLHPYMTTGKTIALTRQTFVGKVMSLIFKMWIIKLGFLSNQRKPIKLQDKEFAPPT